MFWVIYIWKFLKDESIHELIQRIFNAMIQFWIESSYRIELVNSLGKKLFFVKVKQILIKSFLGVIKNTNPHSQVVFNFKEI